MKLLGIGTDDAGQEAAIVSMGMEEFRALNGVTNGGARPLDRGLLAMGQRAEEFATALASALGKRLVEPEEAVPVTVEAP